MIGWTGSTWIIVLLAAGLCIFGWPVEAHAGGERYAVLVGVGKYHPDTIERVDLKGPAFDLITMQEILGYYGFNDSNTTIFWNNNYEVR